MNNKGETIDVELEKKNHAGAGRDLAEIFQQIPSMDSLKHPVTSEYIEEIDTLPEDVSQEWKRNHVTVEKSKRVSVGTSYLRSLSVDTVFK